MADRDPPRPPRPPADRRASPGAPGDDEDREAILARRALFVASALAGLSLGSVGCERSPPAPCLSVEAVDAGVPMPCLTPMITPPDAGATIDASDPAAADASSPDASAPGPTPTGIPTTTPTPTPPQPCLVPPPTKPAPTPPRPCLSPPRMPPKQGGT